MESIPAAFINIFITVFAALTLAGGMIATQDTLRAAWKDAESRWEMATNTAISSVSVPLTKQITNSGVQARISFRNVGSTKIADFAHWNVITEYYNTQGHYQIESLRYVKGVPLQNEWSVEKIYIDSQKKIAEQIEPGVFDPGEEIVLVAQLSQPVGAGLQFTATAITPAGQHASVIYARNVPPILATNPGFKVAVDQRKTITAQMLTAEDPDNTPDELTYTVVVPPAQGILSMPETFTQADIDEGLVTYTHNGSGTDSFQVTISDGIDISARYTVQVGTNARPILVNNVGLTLQKGATATITEAMLKVTDEDDQPSALTYTVVQTPDNGQLGLGTTFTQDDIDKGYLKYIHGAADPGTDSFKFRVSDGDNIIGTFTFTIQIN